jgi:hypothetical protein
VKVRIIDELTRQIVNPVEAIAVWRRRTLQPWKFAKL